MMAAWLQGLREPVVSSIRPSLQLRMTWQMGSSLKWAWVKQQVWGLMLRPLVPQDLGSEFLGAAGLGEQPGVLALRWHGGEHPSWSRPLSVWQAVTGSGIAVTRIIAAPLIEPLCRPGTPLCFILPGALGGKWEPPCLFYRGS